MSAVNGNEELIAIGNIIEERKHDSARAMKENEQESEQAEVVRAELFQLFADGLKYGKDATFPNITEWGKRIGRLAIEHGVQLEQSLLGTTTFRTYVWDMLEDVFRENQFSSQTVFQVARIIDPLLDQAVYAYSTSFIYAYKDELDEAHDEFLKLSAPVVPVLDGIAILPIIGSVDEKRAFYLMDTTLQEATQKQLNYLFIDLSGVTIVDTMVANSIHNIIQSLELIGVKAILSGIRPEVAHTMVSLGINFSDIQTYNSLQQALSMHAFDQ
ncbi:STAS domain-containing protein [Pontibacillus salicampi]|uniref:STAS domain-containing protein n=1 Tax=Pontibacillus salicampi TaxID=1449801 RepID=A0ABV6LQN6_9BACI